MAKKSPTINGGSMSDISFLLLTFFLLTSSINTDLGIARKLPPPLPPDAPKPEIHDRNVFKVAVNFRDWGITKFFPQFDSSKGVSLIVVNTDKGEQMLSAVKDKLIIDESNIDDAAKYNGNLVHKTNMPLIRQTIFQTIKEKGYPEVARTIFRPSNYYRLLIKERIKSSLGDKNLKIIKAILKKLKIR